MTIWGYGAEGILPESMVLHISFLSGVEKWLAGDVTDQNRNQSFFKEIGYRMSKNLIQVISILVYFFFWIFISVFNRFRERRANSKTVESENEK